MATNPDCVNKEKNHSKDDTDPFRGIHSGIFMNRPWHVQIKLQGEPKVLRRIRAAPWYSCSEQGNLGSDRDTCFVCNRLAFCCHQVCHRREVISIEERFKICHTLCYDQCAAGDSLGKDGSGLFRTEPDLGPVAVCGKAVNNVIQPEHFCIRKGRVVEHRLGFHRERDMGSVGFQVLDQEPVKDDLTAVVAQIDDPRYPREDPVCIIDDQPFFKFLAEKPGKVAGDRMPLDPVVKSVPDNGGKDIIPEGDEACTDIFADCNRFSISLIFEILERIGVFEQVIGLMVEAAGNLGMA